MASSSTIDVAKAASKRKLEADEQTRSKRAKRDKRKPKDKEALVSLKELDGESFPVAEPVTQNAANTDSPLVETRPQQVKHDQQKTNKSPNKKDPSQWKLSQPTGGRMLDVDPILTSDDQYLIIAYTNSVQVYSAADSLLFRRIALDLSAKVNERVVAIARSPTSPNLLWIASSTGRIWQGDWMTGTGFDKHIQLDCIVLTDLTIQPMSMKNRTFDVPFVSLLVNDTWQITACYVQDVTLKNKKILLSRGEIIENLKSMNNGQALAATSRNNIIFGAVKSTDLQSIKELAYEFFVLDCPDEITCLDLRVAERIHLNRKSQKQIGDEPVLEVVVGCARGAIYFYNDLLPQLRYLQKVGARGATLQPRKYHWHRRAVHAVKWSQDGNYIISGGSESVLVQWQLDTQKIDVLPHLTATIENIVISDRGSSYIVHLDDNSTMVMTTAEMKPITYIAGIQSLVTPKPPSKDNFVKRIGHVEDQGTISRIPAVINPKDRTRLLLCVSNSQQGSAPGATSPMPLLQTLDLSTTQGLAKQAMTRTHPTDVNTTSKGYPITEPRVAHMAYTHDAKWLATVDEWQPPSRDTEVLDGPSSERLEVFLKFWATQPDGQALELVSRINAPHYTGRDERVLDLAADSTSHTFATIGEDGVLRLWRPAVRQRDGIIVKSRTGREMESWVCASTVHLQENKALADPSVASSKSTIQRSGAVSFSEDGSMIACAFQNGAESAVYLVDVESGTVVDSLDGLIHGQIQSIRVLASQLVVLSQDLVVYDIVQDELSYGIQLSSDPAVQVLAQLEVDYPSRTFAVAISRPNRLGAFKSEVAVFNANQSEPESVYQLASPVVSLVTTPSSSGYLVVDSSAQVSSITQSTDTNSVAVAQSLTDIHLDKSDAAKTEQTNLLAVVNENQDGVSDDEMDIDMADDAMEDDDIYPVVVAPQKLAELFDAAPPFAMPPIEDMFYRVTKLFSSKPTAP
ncbi:WD40-repeat-containing domain protein [Truncatella angustata]|uniref:WD40-repeat-containing domain protein n=1 Tax=Truncatella angustata TaxID=152316 RepID=A0A9P8USH6_9PEZI|nr:WD40-repeat-containing domain protein [Truncatella angustata]KAH6657307.1 WD40-repeat-containing domain protein [Truncatella angustata]